MIKVLYTTTHLKKYLFWSIAIIIICITGNSCKKYKPSNPVFYLKSDQVTVSTNLIQQGTGTHNITELYVYVNGKFQGAYPQGNNIPIPMVEPGKNVKINLVAGIKNNGISTTRINYPFYDLYTLDTLVNQATIITKNISFSYKSGADFPLIEGFDTGIKLIKSPVSDTTLIVTNDGTGVNGNFGRITLSSANKFARMESALQYTLPRGESNLYLELDYRSNVEFEVGVLGENNEEKSTIRITPKENWSKIYVSLADAVNREPKYNKHKLYIKAVTNTETPKLKLDIDNIKIVHF
ncbi:MAG: hypothetical protein ACK5QC_15485 [Bacteroidota bacterium]|jgi:peptidoglycan hydrolase-like protein with peptidoglycan-binding domain